MLNEVFLDTNYAVALAADSDQLHQRAEQLADEMDHVKPRVITTHAVLIEIGNSLRKLRFRTTAVKMLSALSADASVKIVPITDELYFDALELYRNRTDKEWSLTDCLSFIVMRQYSIVEALTSDQHFEQAGFRALLRP